jgi:hypothetical protein
MWSTKRLMRMPWKQSLKGDDEDEKNNDCTKAILRLVQSKASKEQRKNAQHNGTRPSTNWRKAWSGRDNHL